MSFKERMLVRMTQDQIDRVQECIRNAEAFPAQMLFDRIVLLEAKVAELTKPEPEDMHVIP